MIILTIAFIFIRKVLLDIIANKIFVEIDFRTDMEISNSTKEKYYNKYIESLLLNDLKSKNCIWYSIVEQKNKLLGHAFILNKHKKSYIFIFLKRKRGQGIGSIALSKLECKPEVKHKDIYIELKNNIKDSDLIKNMLNKNGYKEI